MIDAVTDREPSNEGPKAPVLTNAAEVFLTNPLTSITERDDGSVERTLSTAEVEGAGADPIELTSVTVDGKTSYTLERWDGLHLSRYTWSSDPSDTIAVATPDKTGSLISRPANSILSVLSDIKEGSERLETANTSKTNGVSRIKSALGKLGSRRAA